MTGASPGSSDAEPELGHHTTEALAPRGIAGLLTDLLGKIVRAVRGMAPVAFSIGCQSMETPPTPRPEPVVEAPKVSVPQEPAPVPEEEGPRSLGKFNITFYYVVGEEEIVARSNRSKPPANDNQSAAGQAGSDVELAAATPPETVTLYSPSPACEPIAETTRDFMYEVMMQGTGKLKDGRLVNVLGRCDCPSSPCFHVVQQQWGTGGGGRPLQPFRSVAVDPRLIKLGTLLHVPMLEGRTMPGRPPWGGYVHDGCVSADDTGGAVKDHQLDLFVGRKGWFLGMSDSPGRHSWARGVPVFDGSKICERKGRKIARRAGAI